MIATLTIDEVNIFLMMRIAIANYVLNLMQIGQDFAVKFFVGDCRDIVASQRAIVDRRSKYYCWCCRVCFGV